VFKNKQKLIVVFYLLILISAGWWFFNRMYWNFRLPSLTEINQLLERAKFEYDPLVNSPIILEGGLTNPLKEINIDSVFALTNKERMEEGLTPLSRNIILDQAAEMKAEDMLARQYFAHDSPDGEGISSLVSQLDYRFILIGENLAMGNFKDEQELVQGWMNSPGHRQNILHPSYREIGLAAQKGSFEGKDSWMIVQVFGLSLSLCPEPNHELKYLIDISTELLADKYSELQEIKNALKNIWPRRGEEYRQLSEEYNSLIQEYNNLAIELKENIGEYNNQIDSFNRCIQSF